MAIEHDDIVDSERHEPKGADSALVGQTYVADGAGGGVWTDPSIAGAVIQGIYDYNDLATATTPIALTLASTQYELTNDGAGPSTNLSYPLPGLANLWDVATNRFTFTDGTILRLGDTVDIRFDIEVVTSGANHGIEIVVELGTGAVPYQIVVIPLINFKVAGTYKLTRWLGIYMGDNNTLSNPGRVMALSDGTGDTVKVNGWYLRALSTSL